MLLLRKLSAKEKKKYDDQKQKAISRRRDLQTVYKNDPRPEKLFEKRQVPNHQIPAYDFIILITYMLRLVLFGLKQQTTETKQVQSNSQILLTPKQVDQIYQNIKFLQETFFFPTINLKTPRINTFEQKELTKQFKQIFRNVEIVLKIQQVAKTISAQIQNYLVSNCHQKLKTCKPNQINKYVSPLYQILEYMEKNYPWSEWKKQQILKGINDIKHQNRKKQLVELNFLQILLVSYSREQIRKFRELNQDCEKYFEDIFNRLQEQNEQKSKNDSKEVQQSERIQIDSSRKSPIKSLEKPLISKIDTTQYEAQIEKLTRLEQRLKEMEKNRNERDQSVQKQMKKLPKRINQTTQIKEKNLLILDYNMKKEKNKIKVNKFLKLYRGQTTTQT